MTIKAHSLRIIRTTSLNASRLLLISAVTLSSLTAMLAFAPATADAFPAPLVESVTNHCKKAASSKLDVSCSSNNIEHALNVATYNCKSSDTPKVKLTCLKTKANGYIDKALKTKPKSYISFTKAINKVLSDAKGSPSHPSAGFSDDNLADGLNCDPQTDGTCAVCSGNNPPAGCIDCSKVDCADAALDCSADNCDLIKKYLNPIIQIATVSFGLIAAASLIGGSIMYASSEADPQKTAKAKDRIAKTLFAVIAYMFLYAFLQFLIPGGIF